MKTIKFIIYLSIGFIIISFSACDESWLSPAAEDQLVTEDSTFVRPENSEKFVNACYNQLVLWSTSSFSWIGMSSITSDDADKGSEPGDLGADKDQLDAFVYTATDFSCNEVWAGLFNGVSRCNQALDNVPKFNIDEALKNRLLAETRFLRAYFYFNLVRSFGDVPLLNAVIDADNASDIEKSLTRVPVSQIYDFIESDLNYAREILPNNNEYDAKDIGRATKGAAIGLLAKVSMYGKKWQQSLDLTDQIINGSVGNYALVSDYSTIWREVGENSTESLFEIQGKGSTIKLGIDGYATTQGVRGKVTYPDNSQGVTGWGFNTPSEDLDNAYEPGDLRKSATIIYRGETLWDSAVVDIAVPNPRYNYKAYVSRKKETYVDDGANKNIRILRMGEIYLINAEAANELGQTAKAQSSLNMVRNRAGLGNTSATSQSELRDAIWKERRVELAMEHDRFFDLVRQGRAGQVLGILGFTEGKNEVFPIPQPEIVNSGEKLTQNPGY